MSDLTRRAALLGAGTSALFFAPRVSAAALPATAGLKDHARPAGIVYGASIATENWLVPECREVYERECGIVTTDLDLKFGFLRPARDVFSFDRADAIIGWAGAKGMKVRGHTLIWNEYNPDWLNRCSSSEVARIFDEHIERVVSRYVGRIDTWDVVNEPCWPDHGEPGGYRRGPWYNALGPSYIPKALRRVRSIDPAVKLCINEAHCENEHAWGNAIRPCLARLIGELRHDGVPLDAVGLQCHLQPTWPHNYDHLADYFRLLATNKVDLHVTEMDINDDGFPDAIGRRDQMSAAFTRGFLDRILAVPEVKMVVNWELIDRWTGYEHEALAKDPHPKRLPRPTPYDDDLQRKPMWSAIAAAFDARRAA